MIYKREPGVLVTRPAVTGTGNKLEYKLPDCIVNLLKREKAIGARQRIKVDDTSSKKLSERKLEAETKMAELELYELEGSMIRLDVHEKRLDTICERLAAVLNVIPSKYLSRIQVARTELEAQQVGEKIREETKAALYELGDHISDDDPEDVAA